MTTAPEILALQHANTACRTHQEALVEAFNDLGQRSLAAADMERLSKADRLSRPRRDARRA